jgi:transcriptional regulatory protein RtcR
MPTKRNVVFGLLGTTLDAGKGSRRWDRWRPTVALCQHEDLLVDRLELIHAPRHQELAAIVVNDIHAVSPRTEVRCVPLDIADPWDFEQVYGSLHDFLLGYPFRPDQESYLVHITTGTHVAQICLFLLTESRYFPGRLVQTSPASRGETNIAGRYAIIDLDLSKYDQLASRFAKEQRQGLSYLKAGIDTRNAPFNAMIEQVERVAVGSRAPILLLGPTGAGKTQLARRIYDVKRTRRQVDGDFVEVNCATLRGDHAMSTLFGHVRGAFTGATTDRPGLLRKAHGGVLFLDEIGDLGIDEQAMLLRAIEQKVFYPVGADREVRSDFQLLAGTNRDLRERVAAGRFRDDLLARINLWTFRLPGLAQRPEDIEPNLDFEVQQASQLVGVHVTFNADARKRFLRFATSDAARWAANFRDLNAAVLRMATLAPGGRITADIVQGEIARLEAAWQSAPGHDAHGPSDLTSRMLGARAAEVDRFDRIQLEDVLRVCHASRSLSEAGRTLFSESRKKKTSSNDADRLRKYLARFGLSWQDFGQADLDIPPR